MRITPWIVAALMLISPAFVAKEATMSDLSWLSGHWRGVDGGVTMEEIWMSAESPVMPGLHRDRFDNGRSFFEYLRIEQRKDAIVYVASPRGGKSTEFTLTEIGERHVLFSNPEHDFPQTIEYRREGDTLTATIGGLANGEQRKRSWQWMRVQVD